MNKSILAAATGSMLIIAAAQAQAEAAGEQIFKSSCLHCHGSGAGLQNKVKSLSADEFKQIVLNGRGPMPAFSGNPTVSGNVDALYSYLSGGAGGAPSADDAPK